MFSYVVLFIRLVFPRWIIRLFINIKNDSYLPAVPTIVVYTGTGIS